MTNGQPYTVEWAAEVIAELRQLSFGLRRASQRQHLARVLRELDQRLRAHPEEVGEVYRTRGSLHSHRAVRGSVSINFVIDVVRRLVYVRDCSLLSGFEDV